MDRSYDSQRGNGRGDVGVGGWWVEGTVGRGRWLWEGEEVVEEEKVVADKDLCTCTHLNLHTASLV